MSANRLNVLVTLVIAVAFLVAESGNTQVDAYPQYTLDRSYRQTTPQRYCGKKLSNALQVICDGVYNSMFKKSGQAQEGANVGRIGTSFDVRSQEMELADYPLAYDVDLRRGLFMPPTKARDMINGRIKRSRRESGGVYEECCINPCTMSELSSYCG